MRVHMSWLIHMCDMTHSYVWHDSFTCATWLLCFRGFVECHVPCDQHWVPVICLHTHTHTHIYMYINLHTSALGPCYGCIHQKKEKKHNHEYVNIMHIQNRGSPTNRALYSCRALLQTITVPNHWIKINSLSLSSCLSFSLPLSLSLAPSLSLYLTVSVALSLSVSVALSLSRALSLSPACSLCLSLSLSHIKSLSLSLSLPVPLSLALSYIPLPLNTQSHLNLTLSHTPTLSRSLSRTTYIYRCRSSSWMIVSNRWIASESLSVSISHSSSDSQSLYLL